MAGFVRWAKKPGTQYGFPHLRAVPSAPRPGNPYCVPGFLTTPAPYSAAWAAPAGMALTAQYFTSAILP
mgnify:CR=1 FL=1